ncbi:hypothetical protein QUB52_23335 [Microcoleus sp. A6-C6]
MTSSDKISDETAMIVSEAGYSFLTSENEVCFKGETSGENCQD